jgi:gamma-glutamyl hercynylcysteine S-oxide synthase
VETRLEIRRALERGRAATDDLLAPVSDEALAAMPAPGVPPLVWSYAHVGRFEELWILRTIGGTPPIPDAHDHVYDAFRRERSNGAKLPTLNPKAVRSYVNDVRARALEVLERVDLEAPDVLVRRGFVFGLVLQNELQSQEAMLEALQCRTEVQYPAKDGSAPDRAPGGPSEIEVPGGSFTLGASHEPWAYDNELEPHEVELPPFRIDRAPVTNGEYAEFVESRGYGSRKNWNDAGWEWRERDDVTAPLYWERSSYGWERVRFGRREPITPWEPVQHVSFHEADAFARWAGKRLARPRGQVPLPVGPGMDGLRGEPRPPSLLARAGRLVRRRRQPGRMRPDGRRRVGVDRVTVRAVSRLPPVPLPGVLRGQLRRRRPRAPRRLVGDRRARRAHVVPALGEPRAARCLHRLPLRARRLTAMCA